MPPPYCYDYPRPSVTVDLAVFALAGGELRVLLVRRRDDPFAGSWALPGGFLEIDEAIEAGALRELREETDLEPTGPIEFLGVHGDPGRDPRGRTISLFHATVIRGTPPGVSGGDDAAEAAWRPARAGGPLAFDHDAMLEAALGWLEERVRSERLGLAFLPDEFEGGDVAEMFRVVFGAPDDAPGWLGRMEREGRVWAEPGPPGRFRRTDPDITS